MAEVGGETRGEPLAADQAVAARTILAGSLCTTETAFGYFCLMGRSHSATKASLPVTEWRWSRLTHCS